MFLPLRLLCRRLDRVIFEPASECAVRFCTASMEGVENRVELSAVEAMYFVWWQTSAINYLVRIRLNEYDVGVCDSLLTHWTLSFIRSYSQCSMKDAKSAIANVFSLLDLEERAAADKLCQMALYYWLRATDKNVSSDFGVLINFSHICNKKY